MGDFKFVRNVVHNGKKVRAVTEYPEYGIAALIYSDDTRKEITLSEFRELEK